MIVWFVAFGVVVDVTADPLDTTYHQTFYINTLGVGTGTEVPVYRESMLSEAGGVMPQNVKVGISATGSKIMSAQGSYYDYLPSVHLQDSSLAAGRAYDLPLGIHLNAIPWVGRTVERQND